MCKNKLDDVIILPNSTELITTQLEKWLENEFLDSNIKEIHIIVPFITKTGVGLLENWIKKFKGSYLEINIQTTTYDGNSLNCDLLELENLHKNWEFNEKIKINIKIEDIGKNNKSSRIHAKVYIFKKTDNLGSVYVGSANLTSTGMQTGNEWTSKISQTKDPDVFSEAMDKFYDLWNSENNIKITDKEFDKLKITKSKAEAYAEKLKTLLETQTKLLEYKVVDLLPSEKQSIKKSFKKLDEFSYENFKKIILQSGKTIQDIYKSNNNFEFFNSSIEKDGVFDKSLKNIIFLNHGTLIKEFIKIIENATISDDELINNLFYVTFLENFYTSNASKRRFFKNLGFATKSEYIFDKKFKYNLLEILYILKYKLEYQEENLSFTKFIDTNSFKKIYLSVFQIYAIIGVIDMGDNKNSDPIKSYFYEMKWGPKSIIYCKESRDYNKYIPAENKFYWVTPESWRDGGEAKKHFEHNKIFIVFKKKYNKDDITLGNLPISLFLGEASIKLCTPNDDGKGFQYVLQV